MADVTIPSEQLQDLITQATANKDKQFTQADIDAAVKAADDKAKADAEEKAKQQADLQKQLDALRARPDPPAQPSGNPTPGGPLNISELTDADIDAWAAMPYGSKERQEAYDEICKRGAVTANPFKGGVGASATSG